MVLVFLNSHGLHMMKIRPPAQKMNTEYFAAIILLSLVSICYPNGRRARGRKAVVHFDNDPRHNSTMVTDQLMEKYLKRMPNRPQSPDPPPFECLIFGYLNDKLIDKKYETPEK
jgi:hypothetical protein